MNRKPGAEAEPDTLTKRDANISCTVLTAKPIASLHPASYTTKALHFYLPKYTIFALQIVIISILNFLKVFNIISAGNFSSIAIQNEFMKKS